MQTEKYAVYRHRPTKTADDLIPVEIQYIRQINECGAQQGRRNEMQKQLTNLIESSKFYLNSIHFHLISKFPLSV